MPTAKSKKKIENDDSMPTCGGLLDEGKTMSNTVLKIELDEDLQKKIEVKAFNTHMSVNDYVISSLEAENNFFVPNDASSIHPIRNYRFIHEVDGKILFKETGADAIAAYVGMTSNKDTPETTAKDVGESLAAILEVIHYFESGHFDYESYLQR